MFLWYSTATINSLFLLLASCSSFSHHHHHHHNYVDTILSREQATTVLDNTVMPMSDYGRRLTLGRDAQDLPEGKLVVGSDPVLSLTYGEFPLHSLDQLLDLAAAAAAACLHPQRRSSSSRSSIRQQYDGASSTTPATTPQHYFNVVDLGSGCGRLCLYMALTRRNWHVTGIEISDILHKEATTAVELAQEGGWLMLHDKIDDKNIANPHESALSLLHGPAQEYQGTLSQADLIFCYSTAWETSGFSEQAGTMVLSDEWNQLLSSTCREGCIVVTTDRALGSSSSCGWKLLDQLEVDNPEVCGSIGYIQTKILPS